MNTSASIRIEAELGTSPHQDARRYRNPKVTLQADSRPKPGLGEVLVSVKTLGVCGSDIHLLETDEEGYSQSSVPAMRLESGLQFGHEGVGKIEEVGPGVKSETIGAYVTFDSLIPCLRCATCLTEQMNYCPNAYLLGFQAPGVFGEFAVVPARSVHPINPLIERYGRTQALRIGAMAEPMGVALHAFSRIPESIVDRRWLPSALVYGGGPIGVFFAVKANLEGFHPVVIVEPNPVRQEYARRFVDHVLHPADYDSLSAIELFGPAGPTVILEACGATDVEAVLGEVAPGGVVVVLARTGQKIIVSADALITLGKTMLGARGHVGHVPEAVALLADRRIDANQFITGQLQGLEELTQKLSSTRDYFSKHLKVTVDVGK